MYQFIEAEGNSQTIIALPALGERKEIYEPLVQKMNQFNWLLFDLPGTNKQKLEDYSIPKFIQSIKKVLNELKIEDAHFMGNSIGTWIIQEYYRQYPEDVLSLILLDGGYFFLGDVEPHTQINLPKTDDFEALKNSAKELVKNSPADDKEQYKKYTLHTFIKEGDYYIHHSDETALNALSLEVSTIDYRINNSEIPIFLLIASDGFYSSSPELFGKYIEDFKETNTKSEVYIIENGQHFLPITNTGQVADILLEALN